MEKVCLDDNRETVWHYDNKTKTYISLHPKKGAQGKVMGKFLTDPTLLWQSRLTAAGINSGHMTAAQYKPCDVAYKLWEHWKKAG